MTDSECGTSSAHMCFPTVNIEKDEIEKLNFLQLVDTWQYFRQSDTTVIYPQERLGFRQKNTAQDTPFRHLPGLASAPKTYFAMQQLIKTKKL